MKKKVNISTLSNKELLDLIKTLESTEYNRVWVSEDKNKEIWKELKIRIEVFLRIKNRVHKKYYHTNIYPSPYCKSERCTIEYAYILTSKAAKRFEVTIRCEECDVHAAWCYCEYIRISDFCNPNFELEYSKEQKEKRLEYLDAAIEKKLVQMGALLAEQDKIKKEEGD